jgi:probable HAF family extracellular repeat protein
LVHQAFGANPRGFLYDHSSEETTDLGTNILARAINNNGIIAGSEWPSGEMVTYDVAAHTTQRHGSRLLAEGMNDNGEVVGSIWGGDLPAAFLYRPGHAVVDLNTQIPQGTGWKLVTGSDITNDGRIVGNAIFVDPATGQSRGRPFLLHH